MFSNREDESNNALIISQKADVMKPLKRKEKTKSWLVVD